MEVKLINRRGNILAFVIAFIVFVIITISELAAGVFDWSEVPGNILVVACLYFICKAIYSFGAYNSKKFYFENGFKIGFYLAVIELMKDDKNLSETKSFNEEVTDINDNVSTQESEEY